MWSAESIAWSFQFTPLFAAAGKGFSFWTLLSVTLAASAPLLLAALGGLFSERSGIINIGLEGMMLTGAFAAGWVGFMYPHWGQGGPWVGFLAAGLAGAALAVIHAAV